MADMSDNTTPGQPRSIQTKIAWAFAGVIGLTLIIAATTSGSDEHGATDDHTGSSSTSEVVYEVEGTAEMASITISVPGGGTSQASDIDVPMQTSSHVGLRNTFSSGEFLYLSAQNSQDHGTIICRITVDGVVVAEVTSSGAYVIATCDGTA